MGFINVWKSGGAILESGRLLNGDPESVPTHVHAQYQLSVELTGPVVYRFRGRRLIAHPNSLVVVPPGEPHAMEDPGPRCPDGAYRLAYLPVDVLSEIARELDGPGAWTVREWHTADPRVVGAFLAYHKAAEHGAPSIEIEERLTQCLGHLYRASARDRSRKPLALGPRDARLLRVRDYLMDRPGENPSLSELARLASLERTVLCREFSRAFGVPPHRFMLDARIDRARSMLASGQTIASVARLLGFSDQSHLTRHFKRLVQVPPGRYTSTRVKIVQDPPVGLRHTH